MKILVIPAFAFLALLALWLRRDTRLVGSLAVPVAAPPSNGNSDGLVVAWRRAGVI